MLFRSLDGKTLRIYGADLRIYDRLEFLIRNNHKNLNHCLLRKRAWPESNCIVRTPPPPPFPRPSPGKMLHLTDSGFLLWPCRVPVWLSDWIFFAHQVRVAPKMENPLESRSGIPENEYPANGKAEKNQLIFQCLWGTALSGGYGGISGTIAGAFLIGMLLNMMNIIGVNHFYQYVLKGLLLVFAMILYSISKPLFSGKKGSRRHYPHRLFARRAQNLSGTYQFPLREFDS